MDSLSERSRANPLIAFYDFLLSGSWLDYLYREALSRFRLPNRMILFLPPLLKRKSPAPGTSFY
ncbi:hypothetical protein NC652_027405 [Populus alba x Populus x berolinensis]|nr:hypothetical protein NC652_027405 [Populus alba x Populus x berolinensis]